MKTLIIAAAAVMMSTSAFAFNPIDFVNSQNQQKNPMIEWAENNPYGVEFDLGTREGYREAQTMYEHTCIIGFTGPFAEKAKESCE